MKQTINSNDFHDAFRKCGRTDNFSYEALDLLFDYFEELGQGTGQEIELDVVAICCEYNEDSISNIVQNYSIDISSLDASSAEYEQELTDLAIDYLEDNTCYIGQTDIGLVYYSF